MRLGDGRLILSAPVHIGPLDWNISLKFINPFQNEPNRLMARKFF